MPVTIVQTDDDGATLVDTNTTVQMVFDESHDTNDDHTPMSVTGMGADVATAASLMQEALVHAEI